MEINFDFVADERVRVTYRQQWTIAISDEKTPRRGGPAKMPRVRVTRQPAQTLDKISNMETHIAGSKLSISVAKTRIESVLRLRS